MNEMKHEETYIVAVIAYFEHIVVYSTTEPWEVQS